MSAQSYSREQHEAWLATLNPSERFVAFVSLGCRPRFIIAALAKRGLLDPNIKPGQQLHMLELMNQLTDPLHFTPEMLAMIAPASNTECEIVELAHSLDQPDDKRGRYSYDILMNERVWEFFCTLNPSFLAAIRHRVESLHHQTKAA